VEWTPSAEKLAQKFWPGPLTLILKTLPGAPLAAEYSKTVGLRIPDHYFLLSWLKIFGAPLAQTSANLSGQPPVKNAVEAIARFGETVDFIFTDGDSFGESSTVVDLSGQTPVILRQSALKEANILSVLGGTGKL